MDADLFLRPLGRTGLMISPIGLGCWQFSKRKTLAGKYWPDLTDADIYNIVSVALQEGLTWFDTAELYGSGESEKSLSGALRAIGKEPGEVFIATKWSPVMRFSSNIAVTINDRLNALSPYPIDLYQIHQPIGLSSLEKEIEAMAGLYERRLIKSVGISNYSARQMERAWKVLNKRGIPLASNQVRYNLLDRRIESNGILDLAKRLGITIIAYSPLAQGLLTAKFYDDPQMLHNIGFRRFTRQFYPEQIKKSLPVIRVVKELALIYNVTPSQIALNWLINHHGDSVVAIPGATKVQHVIENSGAMSFTLSDADMSRLDKESSIFR